MPDTYMPDVVVEVAFNAGYTTPAASRTWTDVSAYVELTEGIRIAFGRQDERSTADANQVTLTLDNSDGRFTAGRSASPYYPNVKIGRPIRVKATPPGGTTSTRFVGFIDEWPVEWDGSDRYAKATIRATSRLARLGLSTELRSMPESQILETRPNRYWTLGDPAGSTTAAETTTGVNPLQVNDGAAVTFGTAIGPGTDGLTAVSFATTTAAPYLSGTVDLPAGPQSVRVWLLVTDTPDSGGAGAEICSGGAFGGGDVDLFLTDAGLIRGASAIGPSIADGAGHDVVLVRNGTNEILYVDGAQVATAAAGTPGAASELRFSFTDPQVVNSGAGVMAHIAVYAVALTPAQVAAQAEVMSASAVVERTDERLVRILGWVGVPASEITVETGVETMTYQVTSGQSVIDALRDVESTEGGVLFDGRDGNVTFHNRSHRYLATAAATLNMASQHVGADYLPKLDRTALINIAEVSNPTTSESARVVDDVSSDEYGPASTSQRSVATTYNPLVQKASWLVAGYAEPRIRVPSLSVDVLAHQGLTPSAQTLLGLTVGDLLAVTNAPSQSDTTSPSYFIEGYTETIGPESYEITFNLSPTFPTLDAFVLNSATRGVLNTDILAY